MRTLAREGMPEALDYLHRREARQLPGPVSTARTADRGTPRRHLQSASSTAMS